MSSPVCRLRFVGLCLAALLASTLAPAQSPLPDGSPPVGPPRGGPGRMRDIPPPRAEDGFLGVFRPITAEASKATVRVLCDGKEASLGTIVGPNGWVLTKYSSLTGPTAVKVGNGEPLAAKVVGVHDRYDLAMLKIEATGLTPVRFAERGTAPVGNWLAAVGPDGTVPAAVGVMSVVTRTPPAPRGSRAGGGFTSSPPLVRSTNAGYLGLSVVPGESGVRIEVLDPTGAASKAGLKMGDTILSVKGIAVADQEALTASLSGTRPGDELAMKVSRDGKESDVKVTLGQRPQGSGRDMNPMGSELSGRRTGFPTFFQTDMVIRPKDCGGPVCDLDGRVLGIMLARVGRTESDVAPAEAITPLLAELMGGQLSPKVVLVPGLEKRTADLTAALKREEAAKAALETRLKEAREALKRLEEDRATAESRVKETIEALGKAAGELKRARED